MNDIYVVRNGAKFGPYTVENIKTYVESGQILVFDAIEINGSNSTVRQLLKDNRVKIKIPTKGNILQQIKSMFTVLIFPNWSTIKNELFKNKTFLLLAIIGLSPAIIISFFSLISNIVTFYIIAIYFSFVWAIFYYLLFKTNQVNNKLVIALFFAAQLATFLIPSIQLFPPFEQIYALTKSDSIFARMIGFTFGVGLVEEVTKALPLLIILRKAKEPLIPQTLVYYGLISGLGFGTVEGVHYQTSVNTQFDYSAAFFLNIARLTSLPFLHSIWSAIAAYFLSFRYLYPKFRSGLLFVAVSIPAILHGLYDTLGWSILGFSVMIISVLLLMNYLNKANQFRSNLINLK